MTRSRTTSLFTLGVVACATVLLLLALPQSAGAISADNKHTVVPTPDGTGTYATYVIGEYNVDNGETITRVAVTFPAGFDVRGAAPVDAGDTVTFSNQTVTVTFGTPKTSGTSFSVRIGSIRNPLTAGKSTLGNPVFTRSTGTNVTVNLVGKRGQIEILASPYLLLTIQTPDNVQSVDFGTVDPGIATPSKSVLVTVDSSRDFTISGTVTGDVGLMGLTVGTLPATVQAAGVRAYTSVYSMTPPWATSPNVPLAANVVYTVTQQ